MVSALGGKKIRCLEEEPLRGAGGGSIGVGSERYKLLGVQ